MTPAARTAALALLRSGCTIAAVAEETDTDELEVRRLAIVELLQAQHRPVDVAERLGVNVSLVYHLRDKCGIEKPQVPKPREPRMVKAANVIEAAGKGGLHDDWDWEPDIHVTVERTEAAPGSLEKVEILAERARLGLPLWCPDDGVRDVA